LKVLLDHNIPVQIGPLLPTHEVISARAMLWDTLRNGDLLKAAEQEGFAVMVTADQSMFYQQNNRLRKIALVVLSTNDRTWLEPSMQPIRAAVRRAAPGSFERVQIPPSG
jgi:hypothetical protein